jgi:hypothetical protein
MTTVPDGYWIERCEWAAHTDWYVFANDHLSYSDGSPIADIRIVVWHDGSPDSQIDWGGMTTKADPGLARALAAALMFAADEAEGKLRDD